MKIRPGKYRHLYTTNRRQRKPVTRMNYRKRVGRKAYKRLRKSGHKRPAKRLVITEYLISKWELYLGVLAILSVILWFAV